MFLEWRVAPQRWEPKKRKKEPDSASGDAIPVATSDLAIQGTGRACDIARRLARRTGVVGCPTGVHSLDPTGAPVVAQGLTC